MREGISIIAEGLVNVEKDYVEFPIVPLEGFAIVAWPIVASEEELGSHIVGKFVDVHHVAYLLIGVVVGSVGRQIPPFVEGVGSAHFHVYSSTQFHLVH